MLSHLQAHIRAILGAAPNVTLATHGPAGLQAHVFPCVAHATQVYLLLPQTSDHLLNLERDTTAVVTTTTWQLRGHARVLTRLEAQRIPELADHPDAPWSIVVEVVPSTIQITHAHGWGAAETFDLD